MAICHTVCVIPYESYRMSRTCLSHGLMQSGAFCLPIRWPARRARWSGHPLCVESEAPKQVASFCPLTYAQNSRHWPWMRSGNLTHLRLSTIISHNITINVSFAAWEPSLLFLEIFHIQYSAPRAHLHLAAPARSTRNAECQHAGSSRSGFLALWYM
jgi:hypothetical protein